MCVFDLQLASLDEEVSNLKDSVIFLEKRTSFRFELPNGRSVGIKANPSKSCFQVLEPVMKKNGFDIGDYSIHFVSFLLPLFVLYTAFQLLLFFFVVLRITIIYSTSCKRSVTRRVRMLLNASRRSHVKICHDNCFFNNKIS